MKSIDRRRFLRLVSFAPVALSLSPMASQAMQCRVPHPLTPPDETLKGQCPVCGMVRPMWARTWITFAPIRGVSQVCSFHCLADWAMKTGQDPTQVMLTVYRCPQQAIAAGQAVIVMGSSAAGTMSPVSKIVFATRAEAETFAGTCGGEIVDYARALAAAKTGVGNENRQINARRLAKGKIVEPTEKDTCVVCGMYPERYPYGKCQLRSKDGRTLHFCSTQCLFAFLDNPSRYMKSPVEPFLIWVVDRHTGMWISGRTAFYVIGSSKVFGPMGYEALPFNSIAEATAFAAENGGRAVDFGEVRIKAIVPGWEAPNKTE
ncbi:conserved exported hypothetical protein [Desulfosarcina cetonica]|uniref:nitrous oxide reductase accessory protein NosL n=1 Tax=Desulfosarcina cetonica TaxID=90730 RepID=UPI0006CF35E4|nr:nitrous oxide reductase accessory protein NosL [Desulfosarcina cetonica]VTR67209.1 conserved exported hypothetical protein [Desulfosarcina cetonica]